MQLKVRQRRCLVLLLQGAIQPGEDLRQMHLRAMAMRQSVGELQQRIMAIEQRQTRDLQVLDNGFRAVEVCGLGTIIVIEM